MYTPCKLYYDSPRPLEVGDFLKTPAGSAYQVQTIRQDRKRALRRHLGCMRWPPAEIPPDATVHPLHWYPRKKKRGRTLASLQQESP